MTMIDTGTYGAKVQSWQKASPRDLLKRLIEEHPGENKTVILALLRDRLFREQDMEYLESIIQYWFANNYNSLIEHSPVAAESTKVLAERAKSQIKARIRIILLDMVLPNGKPLRDCTGEDCAKAGGWLTSVASKVKPTDIVGNVFSEEQLQGLFAQ